MHCSVYVLASRYHGTLYVGVTSNLLKRIWEHKNNLVEGFTQKYNVKILVYYEVYEDIADAMHREKQLKNWKRQWKIDLINKDNPGWEDLYNKL